MRFSLKWLLAAAVYVAIAAAAFGQTSWVYADLLWAVSLLALVYVALMALTAPPRARIASLGFLIASLCFLLYVTAGTLLGANSTPITRLLLAAGYEQYQESPVYYSTIVAPAPVVTAQPAPTTATYSLNVTGPPPAAVVRPLVDFAQYVRAGNAAGMMVIGLLGTLVAAVVRRSVDSQQSSART